MKVYLDGIEVPILYHFGGLASFLPIDMLAQLELEPSGFGARYGRGIGGVVVLESRSPRTKRWIEGGEISWDQVLERWKRLALRDPWYHTAVQRILAYRKNVLAIFDSLVFKEMDRPARVQ